MQYCEDELNSKPDPNLFLVLNIATNESGRSLTRAGEFSFEQPELDTEKINSLRVIIAENKEGDAQNKIKYNVSYDFLSSFAVSGLRYKIDFECPYKIYLIANEQSLSDDVQKKLKDLDPDAIYDANTLENIDLTASNYVQIDNTSSDPKPIAMSEIFEIDPYPHPDNNIENQTVTFEKNLFVTRTTTKFSFQIKKGDDVADAALKVKSIKITGLGDKEFLFPKNTVYSPVKDTPSSEPFGGREITSFDLPEKCGVGDYVFTLPENMSSIDGSGIEYAPPIYFTESKGNAEGGKFTCSISMDGEYYLGPLTLPNLGVLPRNTHVKVIITINNKSLKAEVSLVPYIGCILDPSFGLADEEENGNEDETTEE